MTSNVRLAKIVWVSLESGWLTSTIAWVSVSMSRQQQARTSFIISGGWLMIDPFVFSWLYCSFAQSTRLSNLAPRWLHWSFEISGYSCWIVFKSTICAHQAPFGSTPSIFSATQADTRTFVFSSDRSALWSSISLSWCLLLHFSGAACGTLCNPHWFTADNWFNAWYSIRGTIISLSAGCVSIVFPCLNPP